MPSANKAKRLAVVETALCAACGACAKACPRGAIAVRRGLYSAVDPALCVGCGACAQACPASIITLQTRKEPQNEPDAQAA